MNNKKYTVRTLHNAPHCQGEFIVGVTVAAPSPFEAATQRFNELHESSKSTTIALLVMGEDLPRIFFVEEAPIVIKTTERKVVEP